MNEDEAKALVGRAVDLDRVIHEQVLGLTWSPPPLPFTDKSNPQQPVDTAWLVTRQVLGEEDKTQDTQGESGRLGSPMGRMNCRAVKRLMELLCDEMVGIICLCVCGSCNSSVYRKVNVGNTSWM